MELSEKEPQNDAQIVHFSRGSKTVHNCAQNTSDLAQDAAKELLQAIEQEEVDKFAVSAELAKNYQPVEVPSLKRHPDYLRDAVLEYRVVKQPTAQTLKAVHKLREKGLRWWEVAKVFGVSERTAKRWGVLVRASLPIKMTSAGADQLVAESIASDRLMVTFALKELHRTQSQLTKPHISQDKDNADQVVEVVDRDMARYRVKMFKLALRHKTKEILALRKLGLIGRASFAKMTAAQAAQQDNLVGEPCIFD